jgi:hypothetical protein
MKRFFLPPAVAAVLTENGGSLWLRDALLQLMFMDPAEAEAEAKQLHDAVTAWRHAVNEHTATLEAWGFSEYLGTRRTAPPPGGN